MSDVTVRREVKDDLQAIDRVNREVFGTGMRRSWFGPFGKAANQ